MDLLDKIHNVALLDNEDQFVLFQEVSNAINSRDESIQKAGRDLLINLIDVWNKVPTHLKPMWEDLIEAAGFYPYIEKYKMSLTDFDSRIREEYHKSKYKKGQDNIS